MEQSVPAYLVALAVGKLEFAQTGPRTGVYAEPPLLAAAAFEFSDVEHMIRTTESLYGPYHWGRFDLLVLPPSFPFGGMENPRVPFITPTLIAGDKSLVALVTHELAHSWSGNLVSNATWSDFWLNEGFTTYIERRIQELLYGRERAEMEEVLERETLESDILTLDPCDQVLHIELTGRDPDEGSTSVPYVKGSLFLRTLEELYGRSRLDNFLRSYFKHFAFQSITTQRAMDFLDRNLLSKNPNLARQISLDEWINKPGHPSSAPVTRSDAFAKVERLARNWFLGELLATDLHTEEWSAQELQHFLHSFPGHITARKLAELDEKFQLTNTHNSETLVRWLVLAIRNDYKPAFNRLEKFLLGVGRRKYLKLLYTELVKTPENRQLAKFIYAKARASYHPITRMTIDNLLLGIDGT
jgi:aminopeptidase N